MPTLMGIVADKYIQPQRVLGLCHLLAGGFMLGCWAMGLEAGFGNEIADKSAFIALYTLSVAFFMPTIALSNTTAFTILKKNGLDTVKDYLQYFEESYLTFSLPNFVSPLTDQETIKKRYYTDNGLLNNFLFNGETKLLENLCAIHLIKQYSNTDEPRLFYYNRNIEVDFYVPEAGLAVQASYDLNDDETRRREISALVSLNKAFPLKSAIIVTRDHEEQIEEGGLNIEVIPVWKWLINVNDD